MTAIAQLAFGRILRMASRPEHEGDAQEYERCRSIIFDHLSPDDFTPFREFNNYASNYGKGDTSQWG